MANALNSLASQLADQSSVAAANTGIPAQVAVAGGGAGLLAVAIIGGVIVVALRARKANKRRQAAKHAAPSEPPQTSGEPQSKGKTIAPGDEELSVTVIDQ